LLFLNSCLFAQQPLETSTANNKEGEPKQVFEVSVQINKKLIPETSKLGYIPIKVSVRNISKVNQDYFFDSLNGGVSIYSIDQFGKMVLLLGETDNGSGSGAFEAVEPGKTLWIDVKIPLNIITSQTKQLVVSVNEPVKTVSQGYKVFSKPFSLPLP
jgi:hypothetical protein